MNDSLKPLTITPLQETPFSHDELFFSITNKKGIIESGNRVFVKISQYPPEELLNHAHNIVRHPDMPKAVFKLLWNTISQGEKIVAYVKNRSKDGNYYWVVATVIPIENGYLSIRFKPSTPLKETVESIYSKMIDIESKEGLDASTLLLLQELHKLGFESYLEFTHHLISTELRGHDQAVRQINQNHNFSLKKSRFITEIEHLGEAYQQIFDTLCVLKEVEESIHQKNETFLKLASRIGISSFNTLISSARMGHEGMTLHVLADELQTRVTETQKLVKEIKASMTNLHQHLCEISLLISLTKVQFEMILFFFRECETFEKENTPDDQVNARRNQNILFKLLQETTPVAFQKIREVAQFLHQSSSILTQLNQNMLTLRVAYTAGKTEIARLAEISNIGAVFEELGNLTEEAKGSFKEFAEMVIYAEKRLNGISGLDTQLEANLKKLKKFI